MVDSVNTRSNKRIMIVVNAVSTFVGAFMMSSINIALPSMGAELAMEAVLLGWVVTAQTLPMAAIQLAAGRFADITGRKRIFIYGLVLFTISTFLCAFAPSSTLLIIFRIFQGLGGALAFTNSIALLTSVFPPEERGRALGISMSFTYAGASAGPFIGGILTEQIGWRSIFFLGGILSVVVVGLVFWGLKGEWAEAKGEKFDFSGSLVFGVSLAVMMYGLSTVLEPLGMVLTVLGIIGLIVFVRLEAKTASPILNVNLFRRNRSFVFSNIATLINYWAALAVIFLITLYLQYTRGYSPQMAGLIMLTQTIFMTATAPIAGRLSDRFQPQIIASIGLALNGLVVLFFCFLNETTPIWLIVVALSLFGIGWGGFSSPNTNAVMGSVETKFLGVASAAVGTMRSVGMILSMAVIMILFSFYIGDAEITPEYYPAFLLSAKTGFVILAILSFAGMFSQFAGRKAKVTGVND